MPPARVCFGLVGPFDVDDLGVQAAWRIALRELLRRRPDVTIRSLAPFGSTRRLAIAADEPVEPLLDDSAARRQSLAAELAAVVVVDGALSDDAISSAYGTHPVVDPRDVRRAIDLLRDPGLATPTAHIDAASIVVAASRWWPYALCEQRRDFLRAMHWWPQGGSAAVSTRADSSFDVVCDEGTLELPAWRSTVEDRLSALAGASRVTTDDAATAAIAAAYGRTSVRSDGSEWATDAEAAVDALDTRLDEIAALDGGSPRAVTVDAEILALRAALVAQREQLAHERVVLADYVRAVRNVTGDQVRTLETQLAQRWTARVRGALRRTR